MPANRSQCLPILRPGQLYLWTIRTDNLSDTTNACRLLAILSGEERKEAQRFRRARDQRQFVIAHALVRLALSQHFPVPVGDWCFDRDRNGKPLIAAPTISPAVKFSLSHTEGLIACLTMLSAEAAVDVEKVEYNQDLPLVAKEALSPTELKALSLLSGRDWTTGFFDYWTLKEAYAKARGLGVSLPFSNIGFELGSADTIRAHFASQVNDDPSAWTFWLRRISLQHTISIAAKRSFGDGCEIILRPVKIDGVSISHEA